MDGRSRRASAQRTARRQAIKAAAVEVFGREGFHGSSVTDVVRAAGVARGTFYQYFDSKEAVFHELLDDFLTLLRSEVVGVRLGPEEPSVRDQLQATVTRILAAVQENRPLVRLLFREAVGHGDVVDGKLEAFYGSLHAFLVHALRLGQAQGIVRELDVDISADCILGSVKQVLERYLHPDAPSDLEAAALALLEHNLHGVSS